MVNGYINLDKEHSDFLAIFENIGVNKLSLKKLESQNEVDIVLTSLSKYGETKKDLSDIETSSKPLPTLIIANNKEFDQAVDLISNDRIEVVSNKSRISEVTARINSLLGDSRAEKLEFKDSIIFLAEHSGIEIELDESYKGSNDLSQQLFAIHDEASNIFIKNFNTPEGEKIYKHLLSRGLTNETVKKFRLGYSANIKDQILKYCQNPFNNY